MAARFFLVSSALALCAVVALFALAADQYEDISTSELASKDAVVALKAMLAKQAAMDKQEQALFATLSSKQKAAVHKAAAAKKAKPLSKDDQIAKLKAQLAAAEAKEKKVGLSVLRTLQSHPLNPASCTQAGRAAQNGQGQAPVGDREDRARRISDGE